MTIPSQGLIICKGCSQEAAPSSGRAKFCEECSRKLSVEYTRRYREKLKANPVTVVCKGCGLEFSTAKRGAKWRCQPCTSEYQRELAQRDKERHALYSRRYRAKQGDAYRVKMTDRRRNALATMTPEEEVAFRAAEADKARRMHAARRAKLYAAYGGKCACCGESEMAFLSIDHVNNDGAEMRRDGVHSSGGTAFYQWLVKSGFPPGFQVLCMNCNVGKHRNGGVCPHQSRCNDYPARE